MARSADAGGTDREPLRGGMREQDEATRSVEPGREGDRPSAPYHDLTGEAGEGLGTGDTPSGSAPREDTPPNPGEHRPSTSGKIAQERGELEREGANAPRDEPGGQGGKGRGGTGPARE